MAHGDDYSALDVLQKLRTQVVSQMFYNTVSNNFDIFVQFDDKPVITATITLCIS